jgi:cell pole-organizing protein PopZ
MRQQGEPSVEEILDSIKKVIARDNRAQQIDRSMPQFHPLNDGESFMAKETSLPEDVLDLAFSAQFLDEQQEEEAVDEAPALLREESRSSMRESLAALAMMAQPGTQPQIVRSGETSLEEMTRNLLRPALAEWLDKNLPAMVERMVADEIARIVGKKV